VKIGVIYPQTEFGDDPALIKDFAQAAEALGYSHITAFDHVLGAEHAGRNPALTGPYTEHTPFHEPFVLFGFMAAATTSIELATGVIILPQRQTALVAKQAAEVDVLSGGRLRLGVGSGWNYLEYQALNEDFATRGKRLTEQVEVLRMLWEQDLVDYTGTWHRIDRANILPRPSRRIPIWFGGSTEAAFRRAARLGDGFVFGRISSLAVETAPRLREMTRSYGHDGEAFGLDAFVEFGGGPDDWTAAIERWQLAGGTHVSLRTMNADLDGPAAHLQAIRQYAEAVGLKA
jgi:probable F420-dependent oxidoreductase